VAPFGRGVVGVVGIADAFLWSARIGALGFVIIAFMGMPPAGHYAMCVYGVLAVALSVGGIWICLPSQKTAVDNSQPALLDVDSIPSTLAALPTADEQVRPAVDAPP
jgi:hypothetical protein